MSIRMMIPSSISAEDRRAALERIRQMRAGIAAAMAWRTTIPAADAKRLRALTAREEAWEDVQLDGAH